MSPPPRSAGARVRCARHTASQRRPPDSVPNQIVIQSTLHVGSSVPRPRRHRLAKIFTNSPRTQIEPHQHATTLRLPLRWWWWWSPSSPRAIASSSHVEPVVHSVTAAQVSTVIV